MNHSLAIQARLLVHSLERHLLGNHLFSNAKALIFAGCYFEGTEARRWLALGMRTLEHEISEQILSDGGHFERSTMYHALVYEDMLDLINLSRAYRARFEDWRAQVFSWEETTRKMGRWLRCMIHPDGEIAFFNDAAIGVAPSPIELFSYSERLEVPHIIENHSVVVLEPSGYIRLELEGAVLLIDAAPIGPSYQSGHAHADSLSFELSLLGKRVVVNSGTSVYEIGRQREWERSTAAHSTLEINSENSSEVWEGFRVARRAYPFDVSVKHERGAIIVTAAHDGYKRLPGRPIHRRFWVLRGRSLEVRDVVEGGYFSATARVYFHPRIKLSSDSSLSGKAQHCSHNLSWRAEAKTARVTPAFWSPEFGVMQENTCLELTAAEDKVTFSLFW